MRNRGNFYGTSITTRDGKRYGREVARQARTLRAAIDAVDSAGTRGWVERWSDSEQRRSVVAERDDAGTWWTTNPFSGEKSELDRTKL